MGKFVQVVLPCVAVILLFTLNCGCASIALSYDPIVGNWTARNPDESVSQAMTLVFKGDGTFCYYLSNVQLVSGFWMNLNSTCYEVVYDNQTTYILMNDNRTQIYEVSAPDQTFLKG